MSLSAATKIPDGTLIAPGGRVEIAGFEHLDALIVSAEVADGILRIEVEISATRDASSMPRRGSLRGVGGLVVRPSGAFTPESAPTSPSCPPKP